MIVEPFGEAKISSLGGCLVWETKIVNDDSCMGDPCTVCKGVNHADKTFTEREVSHSWDPATGTTTIRVSTPPGYLEELSGPLHPVRLHDGELHESRIVYLVCNQCGAQHGPGRVQIKGYEKATVLQPT